MYNISLYTMLIFIYAGHLKEIKKFIKLLEN